MSLKEYVKRGARFILRGVPVKNVTADISYLQPGTRLSEKKIIVTGGGKVSARRWLRNLSLKARLSLFLDEMKRS